jgi:hypothetical protein
LTGFVRTAFNSPAGGERTIWVVAAQQAPAENFDKPAPRHPASKV